MFRTIKIILGKDKFNPSTLFNPFKQQLRLSIWRVFFKNLVYELFWRNWYQDDAEELRRVYVYTKTLEHRIKELEGQAKWVRK